MGLTNVLTRNRRLFVPNPRGNATRSFECANVHGLRPFLLILMNTINKDTFQINRVINWTYILDKD